MHAGFKGRTNSFVSWIIKKRHYLNIHIPYEYILISLPFKSYSLWNLFLRSFFLAISLQMLMVMQYSRHKLTLFSTISNKPAPYIQSLSTNLISLVILAFLHEHVCLWVHNFWILRRKLSYMWLIIDDGIEFNKEYSPTKLVLFLSCTEKKNGLV